MARRGDWSSRSACLFSYLRPEHERRGREAVRRALPDAAVSVSHEVSPVWREYERASTTIADAFVKPVVDALCRPRRRELQRGARRRALEPARLERRLLARRRRPPAPGPAADLGPRRRRGRRPALRRRARGHASVFTLDMGGTSCDIGLVARRRSSSTRRSSSSPGASRSTIPCVVVHTIGAGGGSIAWIDKRRPAARRPAERRRRAGSGRLRPRRRRSRRSPTPTSCSGGSTRRYFLGGRDAARPRGGARRARGARRERSASTRARRALAAVQIADENMANAIRLIAVERGLDPRDFALIAFGGAGPAARPRGRRAARDRDRADPAAPGLCSAFGAAIARRASTACRRFYAAPTGSTTSAVRGALERLAEADRGAEPSVDGRRGRVASSARRMRYCRPELRARGAARRIGRTRLVASSSSASTPSTSASTASRFPGEPIELINLRVTALSRERRRAAGADRGRRAAPPSARARRSGSTPTRRSMPDVPSRERSPRAPASSGRR